MLWLSAILTPSRLPKVSYLIIMAMMGSAGLQEFLEKLEWSGSGAELIAWAMSALAQNDVKACVCLVRLLWARGCEGAFVAGPRAPGTCGCAGFPMAQWGECRKESFPEGLRPCA